MGIMDLSVVIPAYNEANRLTPTLDSVASFLAQAGLEWEILVVDDGSHDNTAQLVLHRQQSQPRIRLLQNERNLGKGAAVRKGILAAAGDQVLFSDADLSTPISELPRLRSALQSGASVAIGSRALHVPEVQKKDAWYRALMGRVFNICVRILAVRGIHDTQCGFKLFTREAAQQIFSRLRLHRFAFDVEALALAKALGYTVSEVAVNWYAVPGSKVNIIRDSLVMFGSLFRIAFNRLFGVYRTKGEPKQ